MTGRDSIEEAFCILHQKQRVYEASRSALQRDDIEYAVSSFVNSMDRGLLESISGGKEDFLMEHSTFDEDIKAAISRLSEMLEES